MLCGTGRERRGDYRRGERRVHETKIRKFDERKKRMCDINENTHASSTLTMFLVILITVHKFEFCFTKKIFLCIYLPFKTIC